MDEKIERAMERIVEETLKEQPLWEADYRKQREEGGAVEIQKPSEEDVRETEQNTENIEKKILNRIKEKYIGLFKGKKWNRKKIYILSGIAAGVLAIVYFCGVWYYSDRLFEGTRIGSVLCGNMTAEEAEQAIKDQVENYSVEIVFKDSTEEIQGKDIGYT